MSTALVDRIDLPPDPSSVGQARSFVTARLKSWGCSAVADTGALLTSELAANVVLHAHTRFAVVLTRTPSGAQVDVLDSSDDAPVLRAHDLAAPSGRGLAIVACLASEWGATPPEELIGFRKGVRFALG
ncbi:MAG TPA: ATP-binding protein [Mycobacteriales bacterium]|nr:ATP-binding protein [Mycobacteriales bacterium]